nr:hypothetical protein [Bacteroidales bacterium]
METHLSYEQLDTQAQEILASLDVSSLKVKDRLVIPDQIMPTQLASDRVCNMEEVAIGYSEAQVKVEALRCLQCKNAPCIKGCPINIDIPRFIDAASRGDYATSVAVIKEAALLPAICGRVCPQESQCQLTCTVGKSLKSIDKAVNIGRIERYVADWEARNKARVEPHVAPPTGKKVGVVGSGPASMTSAADLRREGH